MVIGTKGNKAPVKPEYYQEQLVRQMKYLQTSSELYDKGDHAEAIRLAGTIRVLLHDTQASTSLLNLLGFKSKMDFVDTGIYRHLLEPAWVAHLARISPGTLKVGRAPSEVGLVELGEAGNGRVGWYAPLRLQRFSKDSPAYEAIPRQSDFEFWWRQPLIEGTSGKSFSRADLILIMANQDGASHVDGVGLDADYQDLTIDTLGVQMEQGEGTDEEFNIHDPIADALHNVAWASVRQIAFEVLVSISRYQEVLEKPGLFALSDPFADLIFPPLPHRPILVPQPTLIGEKTAS